MAAPAPGADSKEPAGDGKKSPKSPSNFYGYLFDTNKAPTKTLDSLLRAVGKHIIAAIGDKNVDQLTPPKLAAFYQAVGGNYDSLFVNVPYESISFIWQFTGCQYSLQPVDGKDYDPPTIPALTLRGFVHWEAIEILLGPEEHVPFLQYAVKNWNLKHPDTGEPFPTDLPKEAFPSTSDPDIDRWHKSCAAKLKQQALPEHPNFRAAAGAHSRPQSSERPEQKARMHYAYVRNPNADPQVKPRPATDFFARPVRVVPGRVPSQRVPVPPSPKFRPGSSSDERARRRSLSDHPSPSPENGHAFTHLHAERPPGPARRHSQPRHHSSSDSISDSDDAVPRTRHRPGSGPEENGRRKPGTVRHVPARGGHNPLISSQTHPDNRPGRSDDPRKRSLPFTVPEVIRDKFDSVKSFVSNNGRSPDRHRSASGRRGERERERERDRENARRNRDHMVASKLRGSWEDLDGNDSDGSDSSVQRQTRMRLRRAEKDAQIREEEQRVREQRERDRERERERERDRGRVRGRGKQDRDRDRDWEKEKEREREEELDVRKRRERERERFLSRPEVHRRTSSHADIDRMREEVWDPRDREFRDEKRRWREKERPASPVTGVSGRRYPPEPVWN